MYCDANMPKCQKAVNICDGDKDLSCQQILGYICIFKNNTTKRLLTHNTKFKFSLDPKYSIKTDAVFTYVIRNEYFIKIKLSVHIT